MVITFTNGTPDTNDDAVVMVLEDYAPDLTYADFVVEVIQTPAAAANIRWWEYSDLNREALRHRILNPACLPISPYSRFGMMRLSPLYSIARGFLAIITCRKSVNMGAIGNL